MPFKLVFLLSDLLVYLLLLCISVAVYSMRRSKQFRYTWRKVFYNPLGTAAAMVLLVYIVIGLLDSIHFRTKIVTSTHDKPYYSTQVKSLFDELVYPLGTYQEKTYSAPFAITLYTKQFVANEEDADRIDERTNPLLLYAGQYSKNALQQYPNDIFYELIKALAWSFIIWMIMCIAILFYLQKQKKIAEVNIVKKMIKGRMAFPWRSMLLTSFIFLFLIFSAIFLATKYHVLGTDKVGNDVFYAALKSVRTGLLIGSLTTLVMLPFAVVLGTMAGYFGGFIDDIIQYIYTTLSSIPSVLLIAASVLSIQIYIDNHSELFNMAMRADARLLALCIILGVTSWTSLCRVLRGETLKLREMDYILAARALGSTWIRILSKHVLPNVFHIILITIVLEFSGLVLAEAVLTYVGVGVDPTTFSWGNMIDSGRFELARDPLVWWPLLAAFIFMFVFVLAANIFADVVRDAFDPKSENV